MRKDGDYTLYIRDHINKENSSLKNKKVFRSIQSINYGDGYVEVVFYYSLESRKIGMIRDSLKVSNNDITYFKLQQAIDNM